MDPGKAAEILLDESDMVGNFEQQAAARALAALPDDGPPTTTRAIQQDAAQPEASAPGKAGLDSSDDGAITKSHMVPAASGHFAVIGMAYPELSLLFLRKTNPLRKLFIYVISHKLFDQFVLTMILSNCITLALSSSRQGFDGTPLGAALAQMEYLWVAVFTAEMVCKVVAMGFALAPSTYLRDGWNILDFLVVVFGWVALFTSGNLTAMRTIRVLRPLRTVTRIRGMRVLVATMLRSLPMLLDVMLMCCFTFFILGIVGVQLFSGALRYRCAAPSFEHAYTLAGGHVQNVTYTVPDNQSADLCSGPMSEEVRWQNVSGALVASAGSGGGGRVCPAGLYCTFSGNPVDGLVSYDNILWAWLTIFQCITQEAWTDDMYYTQDAVNYWSWIFYLVMIIFGSFFLVNLALAVLYMQFSTEQSDEADGHAPANNSSSGGNDNTNSKEATSGGKGDHAGGGQANNDHINAAASDDLSDLGSPVGAKPVILPSAQSASMEKAIAARALLDAQMPTFPCWRQFAVRFGLSKALEYTTVALIIVNTIVMCINWYGMPHSVERATNYINYVLTVYFLLEMTIKLMALGFKGYFSDGMNIFDSIVVVTSVTEMILDLLPSVSGLGPLSVLRTLRLLRVFRLARQWKELNLIIKAMFKSVKSTMYLSLLMLLFMFIAALMGMQLFGYRFEYCDYVDAAAPRCPLGKRVWGDCPNHFDCYVPCDLATVGKWIPAAGSKFNDLAYCQRFCSSASSAQGVNGTAVCETLAMVGKADVPRSTFDSIFWAMLTIFQLLTGENWNNVMYDAMRTTTPWAAVYFIIVMVIGLYLVFNLFIAILLDNFSGTFGQARKEDKAQAELMGRSKKHSSDSDSDSLDEDMRSEVSGLSLRSAVTSVSGWNGSGRSLTSQYADASVEVDHAGFDNSPRPGMAAPHHHQAARSAVEGPASPLPSAHNRRPSALPMQSPRSPLAVAVSSPSSRPLDTGSGTRGVKFAEDPELGGLALPMLPAIDDSAMPFPLDVAVRRASFLDAHRCAIQGAAAADGKGPVVPGVSSISQSISRLVDSIKDVKRSEHLKGFIKGNSMMCLGPDNWFRWRCARIVHNTHFETVILVLIAASSITLALDRPSLDPQSRLARSIRIMDYIFTGAFTVEAILKIIAWGFAFSSKNAYMRNGWNVLDLVVVSVGYIIIILEQTGVGNDNIAMLRVLRTLRALRPLRAASRYEGLKAVVNALFAVVPAMVNVALVCFLFYVLFAILAVNLFKGKLFYCEDINSGDVIDPFYVLPSGAVLTEEYCKARTHLVNASAYHSRLGVPVPAYTLETEWVKSAANFDNVATAMLTLFQIATLELWVDIMFASVDAVGVGLQPIINHNPAAVIFFLVFIAIGAFFVLNLFIGVTLDKFSELQQSQAGRSVFITEQQQQWVDVQKLLLRTQMALKPTRPYGPIWRESVYELVMGRHFDMLIMGTIVVNIAFMAMVHADMSVAWQDCMTYSNLVFTLVFAVEAALKLTAFGVRNYFRDKWNAFDFFVVCISIASVALDFSNTQSLSFMPLLRVLRVVRVFRLIKRAKGLQRLLTTLLYSLPALINVGSVMLLFFFIFGVVGMNLFGGMKRGEYLTRHANFDTFPNALLLLLRMLTGESWDGIMQDCMVMDACVLVKSDTTTPATGQPLAGGSYWNPGADELKGVPKALIDNQCALTPFAAVIFFLAFVLICAFILLNLVIAIILENMMASEVDEGLPVSRSWIAQFVEAWSEADSTASGFIPTSHLPNLVQEIDPPMGTKGEPNARSATQALIMAIDVPNHPGNRVAFMETLHALAGRVSGTELPEIEEDYLAARFAKRQPYNGATYPAFTAAHYHAALYVQAAIRGFMARHKMKTLMEDGFVPNHVSDKAGKAA